MDYSIESMFSLKGNVAVVTGATGGFGSEISRMLSSLGVKVLLVSRNKEKLEKIQSEITSKNNEAEVMPCDITDKESVQKTALKIYKKYGKIDFLINTAGASHVEASVDFNEQKWDEVINVNLKGTFLSCQAFGRYMLKNTSGRIINFSSVRGLQGRAGDMAYAPSKGAINQLTKSLAIEWAENNICVNAIAPTFTLTEMNRHQLEDPDTKKWVLGRIPKGRTPSLEEMMGSVAFFCSPCSNFITGQILYVDGGWTAS